MGIVVLLMREFLIAQRLQILVHRAFERVAHRKKLVGPRARLAHELRVVHIAVLLDGQRRVACMFPHHAPLVDHFVV